MEGKHEQSLNISFWCPEPVSVTVCSAENSMAMVIFNVPDKFLGIKIGIQLREASAKNICRIILLIP